MTKRWFLAAALILGAVFIWMAVGRVGHPDTSSVPSFVPYAGIGGVTAPSWSPDDKTIVYCRYSQAQAQLYTIPANGGTPTLFLSGVPEGCLPAWSADGTRIAFTSAHSAKFQLMRSLGLAHPTNLWTASASGGDPRQVTNINAALLDPSWSPDGNEIAFTAFPGPRIMTAQVSGREAKLFGHGLSPAWSRDGKRVAYYSSESGGVEPPFSIFVRPSAEGSTAKRLSSFLLKSDFIFRPGLDWSPDDERLLAVQRVEDGRWQPVIINVTEDRLERILPANGSVINPRWSHDGKRVAYALTDTGHPPRIEVLTLATLQRTELAPTRTYTTAQLVRYKSAGELEIPSWLYLPSDADRPKHPALVWLHGGTPGKGSIANEFDRSIQYFVDQGFVVLAPNYRGSAGFGDELSRFAKGDDMMPDVIAAVEYLKGLKAVDAAHIGVIGFSFGGYLTLRSITRVPELFAAAVDFFGPSDLVRYYQDDPASRDMLRDLLGGTPEQNASAYAAASPINFIDRVKTPLLILHGAWDDVVPYRQSVSLARALQRAGKDHEFIAYRFGGHGFSGKDDIDAKQQAMRFLLAHLKISSSGAPAERR